MNLWIATKEGFRDIGSHKFRSFLTILGVVLGASSLMTMFALTEGMAVNMRDSLQEVGSTDKIEVRSENPPSEEQEIANISPGLNIHDAEVIQAASPYVKWTAPVVNTRGVVNYKGNYIRIKITGETEGLLQRNHHVYPVGRFFSDLDLERKNRVAVLGNRVIKELFPPNERDQAIGSWINIMGTRFKVIGYFPWYYTQSQLREKKMRQKAKLKKDKKEQSDTPKRRPPRWAQRGEDRIPGKNYIIAIPLTTFQDAFRSSNIVDGVDLGPNIQVEEIEVGVTDMEYAHTMMEQISNALLVAHNGIHDFGFRHELDRLVNIDERIQSTRISGGIIAAIGLLVGGIGITNIMLANIAERIREIGIRRSVGATRLDIFFQVLMESLLLGIAGGLLGVLLATGMVYFLDDIAQIPYKPIILPYPVVLSFSFAMLTGLLAGCYPALKASALQPVEALKFN